MFSLIYGFYEFLFRKARHSQRKGPSLTCPLTSRPGPDTRARLAQVEYRLLLVGLDKGGKTSCLEKLRAFQLAPHDKAAASAAATVQLPVAPTVGLNIARFELAGCKLTLWDLGGQARGALSGELLPTTHCDSRRAVPVHPTGRPTQHLGEVLWGHARGDVRGGLRTSIAHVCSRFCTTHWR